MELVKRPHARNLVRWAESRPEVLVLSADLTSSCEADDFRDAYPDRFFSVGMAEQNMMGFAAGLAREGYRPHVHTFAVFICRRPFDQVAMSIAYPNLPVRLLGFLPGVTTPGGVTHQAIDDIALMRVLPNMTILAPGDATDVESVLDAADGVDGPVYIRQLRGLVPRLFPEGAPLRVGRARVLSEGDDVTVLTTGICTEQAMHVTRLLGPRGVGIRHLHVATLKPFDDPQLLAAIAGARRGVITLENHSVIGGLGSAVAELMAGAGVGKRLIRLGMQDTYGHGASREYLMREYGLDAAALVGALEGLLGTSFGLAPADLDVAPPPAPVPGAPPAPSVKAEDL
jgi:transketolase